MANETKNVAKTVLELLDIEYTFNDNKYHFNFNNIDFWVTREGRIGVSESYYGKVPHVMSDGALCINRNIEVDFWEKSEIQFAKSIFIYAEWLLNLPNKYCIAEILSELDFYLQSYLSKSVAIDESTIQFDKCIKKIICSTDELWFQLENIKVSAWHKFSPIDLENYYVYVKRTDNDKYKINFDSCSKAKMRVSGLNFNSVKYNATFIGVGSVNSYIIKYLFSKGLKDITLIDNDTVRVDNMFRFAFPYIDNKKIDAVEQFAKSTLSDFNIEKIDDIVTKESEFNLYNAEMIFVSVDNMISWFNICNYLVNNISSDTIVCFVGVDIFGGFGKYIKILYKSEEKELFKFNFYKFLSFEVDDKVLQERKQMIGNGCGKSIAIYTESHLLALAKSVCAEENFNEVYYVPFEN